MKKGLLTQALIVIALAVVCPSVTIAEQAPAATDAMASQRAPAAAQNVPAKVEDVEDTVERAVKRFRIGVEAGVGLNPQIIDVGAHATFAPIFRPNVEFRPGIEFGFGEVTTVFGINLDVLYLFPSETRPPRWTPYVGAGPNFALSHRGFQSTTGTTANRFNFSDTSFDAGMNFIAGARNRHGLFIEMKATAYGVKNVRLLAGFNF